MECIWPSGTTIFVESFFLRYRLASLVFSGNWAKKSYVIFVTFKYLLENIDRSASWTTIAFKGFLNFSFELEAIQISSCSWQPPSNNCYCKRHKIAINNFVSWLASRVISHWEVLYYIHTNKKKKKLLIFRLSLVQRYLNINT